MQKRNRLLSLLLAAMLAFPAAQLPAVSADSTAAVEAAQKKAEITNVKTGMLTLQKGETFRLKTNLSKASWKSSSKKIVAVSSSGMLKSIQNGTATITAASGKSKISIQVTVGTKVSSINVIKPAAALAIGAQSTIKAEIFPSNASNRTLSYQSANAAVASVSAEVVRTAKKTGQTNITVMACDGSNAKETLIVTVRPADLAVRLQDDFYQAINAAALTDHALTENQSMWSGFSDVQKNITDTLNGLIDNLAAEKDRYAKDTREQKIIDFYQMVRDMDARDRAGVEPLKPYTDKIDQAQTIPEFADALGELLKYGMGSLLVFRVQRDYRDSNKYMLTDAGPSYILPKDYYTGDENIPVQQALQAYIKQMFVLAGESDAKASEISAQVYELQKEFALNGIGLSEQYDAVKKYQPYTRDELKRLYSSIDIDKILKTIGITNFDTCIVAEEENAKKLNSYLTPENLERLKNYAKFSLYAGCSNYLTSAHYQALQALNTAMTGAAPEYDMDTVAKALTQNLFAWEFGKIYTDNYFSEESKKEVEQMTKKLLQTFRGRIQKINWLSNETKQQAVRKLDAMKVKIGYPDKWPSYLDGISIHAPDGLIANLMHIQESVNADAQKLLDSDYDKNQWVTTPQTVNAFYSAQANEITFPAAILQAPFYDPKADEAQNLGAIGTLIGHEITHAFDPNGSEYDENGNYRNWWTQKDREEFEARAQKVKNYYSSMEIANGIFQNGDMTVSENVADMGAMACVLEIVGDDKKAQLDVFKSNAAMWASNQTDQYRDFLLMADVHSLNKIRVNAILPLFEQFYDVFGITKKDAMYVAPEDRVQIW